VTSTSHYTSPERQPCNPCGALTSAPDGRCGLCTLAMLRNGSLQPAVKRRRTLPTRAADAHVCFEMNGARVYGDPKMSDEDRDAVAHVIDAARKMMARRVPPHRRLSPAAIDAGATAWWKDRAVEIGDVL
jgi:hypothetical protein